jgi:hypothetical protein
MSRLYSPRKAFLESSNLTAASRGIARPEPSSMGTGGKDDFVSNGALLQYPVIQHLPYA